MDHPPKFGFSKFAAALACCTPVGSLSHRAGRFFCVARRGGRRSIGVRGDGQQRLELIHTARALADLLGSIDAIEVSIATLGLSAVDF